MTTSPNESDQRIADEVLPIEPEETAIPVLLDTLQPWHRPRKQYIRERQWLRAANQLIRSQIGTVGLQARGESAPEVRYLTLPGIDYLDVRLLGELCRDLGCCLTSTGFLAGEEGNPQTARAKIREESLIKSGYITDKSNTYRHRFEEVSGERSQAYRQMLRNGPFHIVNIDACGSIASPTAGHANRLIDAIFRVVEFQLLHKSIPWLLFVTCDVRHDSLAPETLSRLCEAILENANNDEGFRNELLSLFSEYGPGVQAVIRGASSGSGEQFLKLFSLSFSKWFLHMANQKKWDIMTHRPYCYSTEVHGDDTPTMTCLAFEFLPVNPGVRDRFGVTRASPLPNSRLGNTSIRAIQMVAEMANLDQKMGSCDELRLEMAKRTRELLQEAGYGAAALASLET